MLAIAAFGGAALVMSGAGGAQAARAYGPTPPVSTAPGGFVTVVTTEAIGPSGGTIGPVATGDGMTVTLHVPPGAFPFFVTITLTSPNTVAIGNAGFHGFIAIGGVGVRIVHAGSKYQGHFLKPLGLDFTSSRITSQSVAVEWNGIHFVRVPGAMAEAGSLSLTFGSDPDFAVLDQAGTAGLTGTIGSGSGSGGQGGATGGSVGTATATGGSVGAGGSAGSAGSAAGGAISGATSASTGKPLLGESLLAVVLLLTGAGGLLLAGRQRAAAGRASGPGQ